MSRLLRQTVAVLVALAWILGTVLPIVPADAAVAPAHASAMAHDDAMHDGGPCPDEAPTPDHGKAKPCRVLAVCAKCFQVVPMLAAPAIRQALPIAAVTGVSDRRAESLSPTPLLEPPRA